MGHPTYVREAGKKAQMSPDDYKAPSLSQALLKGAVNQYEDLKTPKLKELEKANKLLTLQVEADFDKELADLLALLQERLVAGCGEAWLADEAYGPNIDRKTIEDKLKADPPTDEQKKAPDYYGKTYAALFDTMEFSADPEEVWARTFAEMVVFSMYGNPGHIHYWKDDASALFGRFPDFHVLLMACQYLSTYAILSRGFPASDVGKGLACSGGSIKLTCFDTATQTAVELGLAKEGEKDADKTHPKSELGPELPKDKTKQEAAPYFAKTDILAKKQAGPGSILAFNPGGPGEGSQNKGPITHVATVLRRHGSQVQFIDTGVLVGNDEGKGSGTMAGGEGGTTDHGFVKGTVPASSSCVAVGVLKAPPGDLVAATKKAAAAQPLGFSRLAVVDVNDEANPVVRFVSRMARMQYPVSRYVWSLRGLPVKGLRVLWMIYTPQGQEFTDATLNAPKDSPGTVWKAARPAWETRRASSAGADAKAKANWEAAHQMTVFPTNIIRGEANGKAVVARHKVDKADGWVEDFEGPRDADMPKKPKPEMGQGYKLDTGATLGGFCKAADTLDAQYVRKPGAGEKGVVDTTGGADFLKPK